MLQGGIDEISGSDVISSSHYHILSNISVQSLSPTGYVVYYCFTMSLKIISPFWHLGRSRILLSMSSISVMYRSLLSFSGLSWNDVVSG